MSKIKSAVSTGINALGTTFAAAVTAVTAGFAGVTAQKIIESGDYNAAAIPLTAAFVAASWGAITTVAAKSTKNELKGLLQPAAAQPAQPEI